ncbi:LETM1-domain-containing protein [Neoconidiobolus thromboides FSU 785]|nr:LETM1-domain-containing protein [Neoconidiobolus thromboides FSU 785]
MSQYNLYSKLYKAKIFTPVELKRGNRIDFIIIFIVLIDLVNYSLLQRNVNSRNFQTGSLKDLKFRQVISGSTIFRNNNNYSPLISVYQNRALNFNKQFSTFNRIFEENKENKENKENTSIEKKEEGKTSVAKKKKPLKDRIKEELLHYYHGFKLFGLECKISSKLLFRLLKGHDLSRREQRQLQRTTTDIFRLVPFLVFLIVPFLELLLPLALKLFPNMLPSTFESKDQAELKRQKLFKARLDVSNFLQETMAEKTKAGTIQQSEAAIEFSELFRKVRNTGEPVPTDALINLAKQLEDELTLDNLSRPQLVSLCRYLNIPAFGTDAILAYQIRNRMRYLRADDRMINAEGVEELTDAELQQACQSRGIRTYKTSREVMQNSLNQWLVLNLRHKVPATILIMSQAFSIPESQEHFSPDAIQATLSSLPEELVKEAELTYSESVGSATNKQRLEVLEDQEERIQEEKEQHEREEEARKKEEEEKEAEKEARKLQQLAEEEGLNIKEENKDKTESFKDEKVENEDKKLEGKVVEEKKI